MASLTEHWTSESQGDSLALLLIPGALRARIFDVDVVLLVAVPTEATSAWHALQVEVDGKRQWARRVQSQCPGQTDGLDYHCQIHVQAGHGGVRIRATAQTQGVNLQRLWIEANEPD